MIDNTIINTIAPYTGTLISGGVLGFACGFFFKKLLKIILFIGGAIIALLSILSWQKMIVIDWTAIQSKSNDVAVQTLNGVTSALNNTNNELTHAGLNHIDIAYPILGVVSFLPAFALGMAKG